MFNKMLRVQHSETLTEWQTALFVYLLGRICCST